MPKRIEIMHYSLIVTQVISVCFTLWLRMTSMILCALWMVEGMSMRLGWWKYDMFICNSIHVQDYDNHVLHEIPKLMYYELLILVMCSRSVMSCQFHAIESWGYLIPDNLVVCLEPVSVFKILSVEPWSIEFSQSHDSGKLSKFSISPVLLSTQ